MFNTLRNILQKKTTTNTVNEKDIGAKTQVAATILLLEAAHADDECSAEEITHIRSTLQGFFELSDTCTDELLELASDTREHEVDLWQFSNQINQESTYQEKISIMETVWHIIYMDGKLDSHEDQFAHKLANLLRLTHKDLINAKLAVKKQLQQK